MTSINEELKPIPSSYKGTPPTPLFKQDAMSVIRRYDALHKAGVVSWDAATRGLTYLQPVGAYTEVLNAWADDEKRRAATSDD